MDLATRIGVATAEAATGWVVMEEAMEWVALEEEAADGATEEAVITEAAITEADVEPSRKQATERHQFKKNNDLYYIISNFQDSSIY